MVKLTAKYLIRRNKANKTFLKRLKEDTDKDFLNRITHLPLQNQFIEQIVKYQQSNLPIKDCKHVRVLYLQCNLLKCIESMENFPNLTHLYLQRNFLLKIENLDVLQNLKKIYLGYNEIQVLEGMEKLKKIKEIHFESQELSPGETVYFEPLTIQNLGVTLQVLNISSNYLTSIQGLKNLVCLKILNASHNYLCCIDDITRTISDWPELQELILTGNKVTNDKWYRNSIIYASKSLEVLDGTAIHPNTKIFIAKFFEHRKNIYLKQNKVKDDKERKKELKFADDTRNSSEKSYDFIDNFPPQESVYLYPAWKLRKNVNSTNTEKHFPRLYWKKGAQKRTIC